MKRVTSNGEGNLNRVAYLYDKCKQTSKFRRTRKDRNEENYEIINLPDYLKLGKDLTQASTSMFLPFTTVKLVRILFLPITERKDKDES